MTLEVVSFVVGIIGILLAIKSVKRKKIEILNIYSESSENLYLGHIGKLKVVYNSEAFKNISAHEFIISNFGSEGIDGDDVHDNYPVKFFTKSGSRIIDYEIVSQTNKRTEAFIKRSSENEVLINFLWLDKNSGIRIKILTDTKDVPELSGKIKNYPPLNVIKNIKHPSFLSLVSSPIFSLNHIVKDASKFLMISLVILFVVKLTNIYGVYSSHGDAYIIVSQERFLKETYGYIDKYKFLKGSNLQSDYLKASLSINLDPSITDVYYDYIENGYNVKFIPSLQSLEYHITNTDPDLIKHKKDNIEFETIILSNDDTKKYEIKELITSLAYMVLYIFLAYMLFLISYILYRYFSIRNAQRYYSLLNTAEKDAFHQILSSYTAYKIILMLLGKENNN